MWLKFFGISSNHLFGKFLRWPLRWIPKNAVVPIFMGSLRGTKWIVGSTSHGCWLGSFEYRKQKVFSDLVKLNDIVFDVGAHVGFYTLLASHHVGPNGLVVAFEPFPRNITLMKRHIELNGVRNVKVIEEAVFDKMDEVWMEYSGDPSEGHIVEFGDFRVQACTLDEVVYNKGFPAPTVIKVDVEGEEYSVFNGARRILEEEKPIILLDTHGPEIHKKCCELLLSFGYTLKTIAENHDYSQELLAIP